MVNYLLKSAKANPRGKDNLFNKRHLFLGIKIDPYIMPHAKTNSKWIINLM